MARAARVLVGDGCRRAREDVGDEKAERAGGRIEGERNRAAAIVAGMIVAARSCRYRAHRSAASAGWRGRFHSRDCRSPCPHEVRPDIDRVAVAAANFAGDAQLDRVADRQVHRAFEPLVVEVAELGANIAFERHPSDAAVRTGCCRRSRSCRTACPADLPAPARWRDRNTCRRAHRR